MPVSVFRKVSSNAKNRMPVITLKLLQDFMTNMLFNALESLFNETMKLHKYLYPYIQLTSTTTNSQNFFCVLVRVEQYLLAPLCGTKCQKFGHHTAKCGNPKYTSWRCSKHHEPDHCNSEDPTISTNCQGNHPSSSKNVLLLIKKKKSYFSNTLTTLPLLKHPDVSNQRLKSHVLTSVYPSKGRPGNGTTKLKGKRKGSVFI